ncbi:hypothetical protein [Zarconia navalis]|uniref:hypothetical protein n=1 Tax=Zarconia navalis TaxID=2992134 RepID=UPI0021F8DCFC|nr:hypothetical protein [Zarconia navalis]
MRFVPESTRQVEALCKSCSIELNSPKATYSPSATLQEGNRHRDYCCCDRSS